MDFDEQTAAPAVEAAVAAPETSSAAPAATETAAASGAQPGAVADPIKATQLFGWLTGAGAVGDESNAPGGPAAPGPPNQEQLSPEELAALKDRQDAADSLRGNFKIVDKNFKGPRSGNTVTQEEFDKITDTYSNVRRGKTDLDVSNPKGMMEGMPLPEGDNAWVGGHTPEEAAALNAQHHADFEARQAASTNAVMGDIGTMMQTAAGRELVYKLSNNVVKVGDKEEHRKTTVDFDASNVQGDALQHSSDSRDYNGHGEDTTAVYGGGDRQLFAALTQAEHITTGTLQRGRLGDEYGEQNTADAHGIRHTREDRGTINKADEGQDRERAAILGLDGYGTTLHGEKITENQYDKEQRANGKSASQNPQFNTVAQEWTYDNALLPNR